MSLQRFAFTDRCRPVVQVGIGDTRQPAGQARWDVARWDTPADRWAGTEPVWRDITCETRWARCEYGRKRTTDRFVAGVATIEVDNATGWADPAPTDVPGVLTMRPGRPVRFGVEHVTLGRRWLFRGFIDALTPRYLPLDTDTVTLDCVDALGEVNRAKQQALDPPVGDGETVDVRINRLLDGIRWAETKRDIQVTADQLVADDLGGQLADLLGQAADSNGGVVFGDIEARLAYRPRDWQTYVPGSPVAATIGNVEATDVCPVEWERPFNRADIATRAIMGRDPQTAIMRDDQAGQVKYGIEPFERTDLLTKADTMLVTLAERALATRGADVAPRVRSVTLDASTATNALDLMAAVDVYAPTRYRCRLRYPRGTVFDAVHFATGVAHELTPERWSLQLNLDLASPYETPHARWEPATGANAGRSRWDAAQWAVAP
jgi:hypothetical protein